jgi:hypothetical protein
MSTLCTPPSMILPERTALLPMSSSFTSPLTMSSEKTVFEPLRATAVPPLRTRKTAIVAITLA